MSYRVIKRDPGEFNNRKAIGVLMPFSSDSVFVPTYSTLEAYKVNLYNFFMTGPEERYLNPGVGSKLLSYLFADFSEDTKGSIQGTIRTEIETYFPKLEILDLVIEEYVDDHSFQIYIDFAIKGTELKDSLTIDITQ